MTDIEKARKAAEAAAAKLAEAEAIEAEKAAQRAAERAERQRELDEKFLREYKDLEAKVRGPVITVEQKAAAFEAGTLHALLTDYLARREAVDRIRSHAYVCATRLGRTDILETIKDLRYVDPSEELRRWTEDAMYHLKRQKMDGYVNDALAPYEAE
ncbi:hypothetical protein [Streptomyces pseudogriseolus]|uniref:hypothetical protein n=1 Tax=Streptomyces pseudogriseolus TaxID=36817 RepID=UPI00347F8A5B